MSAAKIGYEIARRGSILRQEVEDAYKSGVLRERQTEYMRRATVLRDQAVHWLPNTWEPLTAQRLVEFLRQR